MKTLFFLYLKQRWKLMGLFVLFAAIEMLVFALYALPLAAVLYPLGLCFVIGVLALVGDFRRVSHRHKRLCAVKSMTDALLMALPEPESITDGDYQAIIRLLCEGHRQHLGEANRRYQEMMDYYTVWAHQIKTPIASMRLHLQNEDTPLSRQLSSDLTRTEQYADMVLAFLRLDADSTDYVIRACDLDAIVRGVVRRFAGEFIARRLTLEMEPLNAKVITDEKWLSFVVEQVLSNALKYTPSGSIRIHLEAPKTLCIRDTGIGIAAEDLPRIFEMGYTGLSGRSDKRASGIGLYLCRRICANLGHTISAESVPGEGTVIRIHLEQMKLEVE
ncbi:MAG: sensor histidine kinase [Aristaeellaceae bacterium]